MSRHLVFYDVMFGELVKGCRFCDKQPSLSLEVDPAKDGYNRRQCFQIMCDDHKFETAISLSVPFGVSVDVAKRCIHIWNEIS